MDRFRKAAEARDEEAFVASVADDVVFKSPIVFRPSEGVRRLPRSSGRFSGSCGTGFAWTNFEAKHGRLSCSRRALGIVNSKASTWVKPTRTASSRVSSCSFGLARRRTRWLRPWKQSSRAPPERKVAEQDAEARSEELRSQAVTGLRGTLVAKSFEQSCTVAMFASLPSSPC